MHILIPTAVAFNILLVTYGTVLRPAKDAKNLLYEEILKKEIEIELKDYVDNITKGIIKKSSKSSTKDTPSENKENTLISKDTHLRSLKSAPQWHRDSKSTKDTAMRLLLEKALEDVLQKGVSSNAERKREISAIVSQLKEPTSNDNAVKNDENNQVETCFDVYGKKKCQELVYNLKLDCDKDRLHEMCERSCGYCRVPSPPMNCERSQFGCCEFDNLTPKNDPLGTKCPKCEDKSPKLCAEFESECNEIGMGGEWMRRNCMKTCHGCSDKKVIHKVDCSDEKDFAKFCPLWKQEGLCNELPDLTMKHCKKSCGGCH